MKTKLYALGYSALLELIFIFVQLLMFIRPISVTLLIIVNVVMFAVFYIASYRFLRGNEGQYHG